MFYLLLVILLGTSSLFGQTADMVVKAATAYNLQGASLVLDSLAKEADSLIREAQLAERCKSHWGQALSDYARASALIRNVEWTPDVELAGSLRLRLDHAILDSTSGNSLREAVSVRISYPAPSAAQARLMAAVYLIGPNNTETELVPFSPVNPDLPWRKSFAVPSGEGRYAIEVRLTDLYGSVPKGAESIFRKSAPLHIEDLSDAYHLLNRSYLALSQMLPDYGVTNQAVLSARETLDLYRRADRGQVDPRLYDFRNEFASAQLRVDEALAGR